jgi:hypothetical protein
LPEILNITATVDKTATTVINERRYVMRNLIYLYFTNLFLLV